MLETNTRLNAVRALIKRHQFVTALVLVVVVTGFMTGLSMWLYIQSGASGLDLSRPGFTNARSDLQQEITTDFQSTGPLTEKDLATFKKLYEKQRTALNSLSAFDDDAISDEELGLVLREPQPTSNE
jgi:hypothetical protein